MGSQLEEKIKQKAEVVSQLISDIKHYQSFLVFEYLGLESQEISDLRRHLRNQESKLIVHKNNTLNRAFKNLNLKNSNELSGPNAILLTKNNIKPFQDIINLSKDKSFIKLKLAYFDNEIIEKDNLNLLSSLGSKEDLLIRLSQTLLSTLYKVAFCLKNINK